MTEEEDIEAEWERRYMKNFDTAKQIGIEFFGGALLAGCEPDWRYMYPRYTHEGDSFTVGDWAMGFIAQRLNLPWVWGYRNQELEHPMLQAMHLIDRLKEEKKEQEKMMKHFVPWKEAD